MDAVQWLEEWYYAHCDGDWEHGSGIHIGTLDNPGWSVSINLEGTELENVLFTPIDESFRSENDWLICRVEKNEFLGFGGSKNLKEILSVFRTWVDDQQKKQ